MEQTEAKTASSLLPGDVVTGTVEQIMPYGAFVRLSDGQRAMIHISQLSHRFIKKVEDVLQLNQEVKAKVTKIDERGRIDLSMKVLEEPMPAPRPSRSSSAQFGDGDDFEKKLSSFLKVSEEKISTMMSKNAKNGRPPRRKGARP
ncbi:MULTISPECIES: S1 RNA-binding domain-containing protein [Jonquetella]|uniref:Putative RNA-binding protein with ribosomal protein S1 domain n=1 Tax=Jonquetella anthropi DSM 22815 TaxID=885272 RepID=H0UKK9_9BACT|nr:MULTISPECIES: S1 RNA-binding domain-containing protein [Jonquetella]EEX48410.1 S1 RNA binding domain protein [Jonquetella anthropi E3_33 E1]EHM13218.1 putative RNA-binding protein with ribosomal protein S1 domain [Jonquetella anthropi DSM 22815]ERL23662.1 S1 RNA binding domain protein [Jonquetella sp. BV3C21]